MMEHILPVAALERLHEGTLFYPAADDDIAVPVEAFSAWITDFWFVDIRRGSRPSIRNNPQYRRLRTQHERYEVETVQGREPVGLRAYHETYERIQDRRQFMVHRCQGRGDEAFGTVLGSERSALSVFFYRGDSHGEGGSDFRWLEPEWLRNVLEVLDDGGLIVSDGSNAIHQLSAFHRDRTGLGSRAMEKARPFTFSDRRFECVGYLGERYGPTLVWQVARLTEAQVESPARVRTASASEPLPSQTPGRLVNAARLRRHACGGQMLLPDI